MSGLENLKTRVKYYGVTVEDRFNTDKLRTLKKALFNSYQAETIVLADGREFKCLINRNKLEKDYDDRYISIPFEDICLNAERLGKTFEGQQKIGLKPGDVFKWKENNSYWITYLPKLEESAYYRATIRRCMYEITINDTQYKIYFRGPTIVQAEWHKTEHSQWNGINYDAMLTIVKNDETLKFFDRFVKVKIGGKNWKVVATDKFSTEGIIDVYLAEDFTNTIEEENPPPIINPIVPDETKSYIDGPNQVYPYDIKTYLLANTNNLENGQWEISNNKKAKIIAQSTEQLKLEIIGNKGEFDIIYKVDGQESLTLTVKILSI
jgi:hypothetical protein